MEKEEEIDRRRGGKTILKIGQGWTLPAQLKTTRWKGIVTKSTVAPQRPSKVMGWTRLEYRNGP